MTEVVEPELQTPASPLEATLAELVRNPTESPLAALREQGFGVEDLEGFARAALAPEQQELLRQFMLRAAGATAPEDTGLAARLQGLLDPRERAWQRILRAQEADEELSAMVVEAVRGGVVVDLGVRGFVPASHTSLGHPPALSSLVGRTLALKVLEVNRRRQVVVLSHRRVLEERRAVRRKELFQTLKAGDERQGVVRRLSDIGAFVDVGGVDGLLHVSEISWMPVRHPSDALKVGQKVQVLVQRVEPDHGRISLSMRRLMPDPWQEVRKRFSVGLLVAATVRQFNSGGVVVELEGGHEGFIPMRELAERRVNNPEEVVQLGQELNAKILEIHDRDRRIVLSLSEASRERERKEFQQFNRRQQRDDGRTTLGDLFGHLFADQLREAAEERSSQEPAPPPSTPEPVAEAPAAGEQARAAAAPPTDEPEGTAATLTSEPVSSEALAADAAAATEEASPDSGPGAVGGSAPAAETTAEAGPVEAGPAGGDDEPGGGEPVAAAATDAPAPPAEDAAPENAPAATPNGPRVMAACSS